MQDKQEKGKLGKTNYSNCRKVHMVCTKYGTVFFESESSKGCMNRTSRDRPAWAPNRFSPRTPVSHRMLHRWYYTRYHFRTKSHRQQRAQTKSLLFHLHLDPWGPESSKCSISWSCCSFQIQLPLLGTPRADPSPPSVFSLISSIFWSTLEGHIPLASQTPPPNPPDLLSRQQLSLRWTYATVQNKNRVCKGFQQSRWTDPGEKKRQVIYQLVIAASPWSPLKKLYP